MLFGEQQPKIIIDPNGEAIEVNLTNVVVLKDEPQEDFLIHQSKFTGHREFVLKGKYWIVELKVHLFKYEYPRTALMYLKNYEGSNVRYYRHSDGDYLKDKDGNEVEMFIESVNEGYYDTQDFKDLLFVKLKSTKYVDMARSVL